MEPIIPPYELDVVDRWMKFVQESIDRTDYTKALAAFREKYLEAFGGEEALADISEEQLKQTLSSLNLYCDLSPERITALKEAIQVSNAARAALTPLVEVLTTLVAAKTPDRTQWTRAVDLQRSYCQAVIDLIRAEQPADKGLEWAKLARIDTQGEFQFPPETCSQKGYDTDRFEVMSELVDFRLVVVASRAAQILAQTDPEAAPAAKATDDDSDSDPFSGESDEEIEHPTDRQELSQYILRTVDQQLKWRAQDTGSDHLEPRQLDLLNALYQPVREFARGVTSCTRLTDSYNQATSAIETASIGLMQQAIIGHTALVEDAERRLNESRIPSLTVLYGLHPTAFDRTDPKYVDLGLQLTSAPDMMMLWSDVGAIVSSLVKGSEKLEKIWH